MGVSKSEANTLVLSSDALTFWYGAELVEEGELSTGDVITTFFAVIIGAMAIGQAAVRDPCHGCIVSCTDLLY